MKLQVAARFMKKDPYLPALGLTSLNKLYDRFSVWAFRKTSFGKAIKSTVKALQLKPNLELLELGCGPGRLALKLKELYPDVKITAIDGDPKILKIAKKHACEEEASVHFLTQDMTQLSLTGKFDRIYSTFVFHHLTIEGKQKCLKKIGLLLSKNGFFVLADFCQSKGLADRLKFLGVQLVDGFKTTTPHQEGWLENQLPSYFKKVEKVFSISTFLGRVSIFVCH